jgi:hypothetical protein
MSAQDTKLKPLYEGNITINPGDPEVQEILGTQCPTASQVAQVLRARGHVIARKIEVEQGIVITWMLALYRDHGMKWREAGAEQLKEIQDWIRSEQLGNLDEE